MPPGLNKQTNKPKTDKSHNKSQIQQQQQFYAYSFSSTVTSNGKKTEETRLKLENNNGKVHGTYKKLVNNKLVNSKIIRSKTDLQKLQHKTS